MVPKSKGLSNINMVCSNGMDAMDFTLSKICQLSFCSMPFHKFHSNVQKQQPQQVYERSDDFGTARRYQDLKMMQQYFKIF